jgi:L-lysine 2,3-aminomutase
MDSKRVGNQAILRSVNDRIRELNEAFAEAVGIDPMFVCECPDLACVSPISVTLDDYRRIREDDKQFIVIPDHVEPELVSAVEATESYVVVAVRDRLA